jgi:hypothetical protein
MNFLTRNSIFSPSVLAFAFALSAFAPGSRAVAQDSSVHLVVTVPFDFRTGSEIMPAGKYDIRTLSDHVLLLREATQNRSQILIAMGAITMKPSERGKLVFHRYGNKYFLSQVWSPGESTGFEIPKSHAEKETIRAANTPAPTTSELALNTPQH